MGPAAVYKEQKQKKCRSVQKKADKWFSKSGFLGNQGIKQQ
jgi:hypothetical protein